jgi:hypothetical protein
MRWSGVALGDPWADPSTIPELQVIIRRRLLSKVRIYEGWCENGDRLLQVIKVNGRPLVLARGMLKVGGGGSTRLAHRSTGQAMWLDLPIDTYIGSRRPLSLDTTGNRRQIGAALPVRSEEVSFMRISAQCAHERISIPADWLIRELRQGVTKRIITEATRMEMGARSRGK